MGTKVLRRKKVQNFRVMIEREWIGLKEMEEEILNKKFFFHGPKLEFEKK